LLASRPHNQQQQCQRSSRVYNPALAGEFCDNVKDAVSANVEKGTRLRKWEICEDILERCDESWDWAEKAGPLPYWPPDFNDHINRLFEREEGGRVK
jgi:hypothetical protein